MSILLSVPNYASDELSSVLDFLLTAASAYLAGLLLNLTPCVYPLISVTVSLFRTQAKRTDATPFVNALIYVAGLATFYGILGLVSSLGIFFFVFLISSSFA